MYVKITKLNSSLFKTQRDSSWTDPSLVGYTTKYNGREVLLTTATIDAFRNYMNSLSLPFTYDHAVGLFK